MATQFDTTLSNLGIGRTQTGPQVQTSAQTTLGQNDFLKLMTAQLKNQDPFAPVDNTQMVAQMAQFSSLAGISEMNTTLQAIAAKLGSSTQGDAMAYVGRTVLTEGSTAFPRTSGGLAGAVELGGDTKSLTVSISDANGAVLRTVNLGEHEKGTVEFDWDGSTDSGAPAGDGPFTVSAVARDAKNAVVSTKPLVWAPVTTVAIADGEPVLTLPGLGKVPASAVRAIG